MDKEEILEPGTDLSRGCCCLSHHGFCLHVARPAPLKLEPAMPAQERVGLANNLEGEEMPFLDLATDQMACYAHCDAFLSHLVSLETDLSLDCSI